MANINLALLKKLLILSIFSTYHPLNSFGMPDSVTPLTGITGSGTSSSTKFGFGVLQSSTGNFVKDATVTDKLTLKLYIEPSEAHINNLADIFIIVSDDNNDFLIGSDGSFSLFDSGIDKLVPTFKSTRLVSNLEIDIKTTTFENTGDYKFFAGYTLQGSSELIYTSDGTPLSIVLPERSCTPRPTEALTLLGELDNKPPFWGTIFVDPDIIKTTDPSTYQGASYKGRGVRRMFDRRVQNWISNEAYLFTAKFTNGEVSRFVEVQVNSEFSSVAASMFQVTNYMQALGRIPYMLLKDADTVWIHKGDEGVQFGGGNRNYLIHTGDGEMYIRRGILEETLIHEGTHTSLDRHHDTSAWKCAQKSDVTFISEYARDNPDREDHAESFLMWLALRYRPERISTDVKSKIMKTIPNRLQYYDDQFFNVYPVK